MSTPHRATPEQWANQKRWAKCDDDSACLIDLHARVKALETAQKIRSGPESPLVERVADAIAAEAASAGIINDRPARAAIREVAESAKGLRFASAKALIAWLEREGLR